MFVVKIQRGCFKDEEETFEIYYASRFNMRRDGKKHIMEITERLPETHVFENGNVIDVDHKPIELDLGEDGFNVFVETNSGKTIYRCSRLER